MFLDTCVIEFFFSHRMCWIFQSHYDTPSKFYTPYSQLWLRLECWPVPGKVWWCRSRRESDRCRTETAGTSRLVRPREGCASWDSPLPDSWYLWHRGTPRLVAHCSHVVAALPSVLSALPPLDCSHLTPATFVPLATSITYVLGGGKKISGNICEEIGFS